MGVEDCYGSACLPCGDGEQEVVGFREGGERGAWCLEQGWGEDVEGLSGALRPMTPAVRSQGCHRRTLEGMQLVPIRHPTWVGSNLVTIVPYGRGPGESRRGAS